MTQLEDAMIMLGNLTRAEQRQARARYGETLPLDPEQRDAWRAAVMFGDGLETGMRIALGILETIAARGGDAP